MRSWVDVSLEFFGTVDHAFELAEANDAAITETPKERDADGKFILKFPEDLLDQINQDVYQHYQQYSISPATGVELTDRGLLPVEKGICFMEICKDFKVSTCV